MNIKCKASKRFLFRINIEEYISQLNKLTNTKIELPLIIEIPCRNCRMIEVYEVYHDHYKHIRSYKK